MTSALAIWLDFCQRFRVIESAVPLFDESDGLVKIRPVGRSQRPTLCRSRAMEAQVRSEVETIIEDHPTHGNLDGLLYMMGMKRPDHFLPLYIGKAETLGRGEKKFSANLKNLNRDTSKFARWGDGYAYHIGDLSACALLGHPPDKQTDKYRDWASALFLHVPTARPVLREQVWFWAKAWNNQWSGIWQELGPTRLAFLEYTLIGVASMVSPQLLNREGRQR